jgi:hypothetical protein
MANRQGVSVAMAEGGDSTNGDDLRDNRSAITLFQKSSMTNPRKETDDKQRQSNNFRSEMSCFSDPSVATSVAWRLGPIR